jgi:flagellar assembly factor FliW
VVIDIDCTSDLATPSVEVTFPAGLPGFPHAHCFQLAPLGTGETPFLSLRAMDDRTARFVVVSPWTFYPDYEFGLREEEATRLGVSEPRDVLVFCMVTLSDKPQHATVNLLGPIVVNRRTLDAAQVVVPAIGYGVRTPLAVAS